jgi:arylformamidase
MGEMVYRGYGKDQLDAQYNVRAAVPEFQTFFDDWAERSLHARERLLSLLNVAYGGTPLETMDIFPASQPKAPMEVFIHGGYWQRMDKSDYSFIAEGLVPFGAAVALLNYGLAPSVGMDEIVAQNRAALKWIWYHASEFGVDPARIYISGHSAGGHLVAMLMTTDWAELDPGLPGDLVKGGCSVSGLYDLEPIRLSYQNSVLGMDEETAKRNSPICHLPKTGRPLIISVGGEETDEFQRQAREFAKRWRAMGFPLEWVDMLGSHHFSTIEGLADRNGPLNRAVRNQMRVYSQKV